MENGLAALILALAPFLSPPSPCVCRRHVPAPPLAGGRPTRARRPLAPGRSSWAADAAGGGHAGGRAGPAAVRVKREREAGARAARRAAPRWYAAEMPPTPGRGRVGRRLPSPRTLGHESVYPLRGWPGTPTHAAPPSARANVSKCVSENDAAWPDSPTLTLTFRLSLPAAVHPHTHTAATPRPPSQPASWTPCPP